MTGVVVSAGKAPSADADGARTEAFRPLRVNWRGFFF